MTITLEVRPEIEAELARLAAERGMRIDIYAASLLDEAARLSVTPGKSNPPAARDMVELFAPLRGLNLNFERVAVISTGEGIPSRYEYPLQTDPREVLHTRIRLDEISTGRCYSRTILSDTIPLSAFRVSTISFDDRTRAG
jgi:hypothetical protein